jgi:hypothetical protein
MIFEFEKYWAKCTDKCTCIIIVWDGCLSIQRYVRHCTKVSAFLHRSWDVSIKFPKIPQLRILPKYFMEFLHADLRVREDRQGEYNYYKFDTFSSPVTRRIISYSNSQLIDVVAEMSLPIRRRVR